MNMNQIRYFLVTAEYRSFTKAAEQLFITQPALSRQISAMESELNLLLFTREQNHKISLTPAGKYLQGKFKKIYDGYSESVQTAREISMNLTGSIKIGILTGMYSGDILQPVVEKFEHRYQNVSIDLSSSSFGILDQKLYQGELDVILTLFFDVQKLDSLQFKVLKTNYDCLAMTETHRLASQQDVSLKDILNTDRFIIDSREDSSTSAQLIIDDLHNNGVFPEIIYAKDLNTLQLMVTAGYGIAILDARNMLRFVPGIVFRKITAPWDVSVIAAWSRDNTNPYLPLFLKELDGKS